MEMDLSMKAGGKTATPMGTEYLLSKTSHDMKAIGIRASTTAKALTCSHVVRGMRESGPLVNITGSAFLNGLMEVYTGDNGRTVESMEMASS